MRTDHFARDCRPTPEHTFNACMHACLHVCVCICKMKSNKSTRSHFRHFVYVMIQWYWALSRLRYVSNATHDLRAHSQSLENPLAPLHSCHLIKDCNCGEGRASPCLGHAPNGLSARAPSEILQYKKFSKDSCQGHFTPCTESA